MTLFEAIQETVDRIIEAESHDPDSRAFRMAYHQYLQMRPVARTAFAKECGARPSRTGFSLNSLAQGRRRRYSGQDWADGYFFDHREYYNKDGKPWCIVSHTYERDVEGNARRLQQEHGLFCFFVETGPVGWYNPGGCRTIVTARLDKAIPNDWHILLASVL